MRHALGGAAVALALSLSLGALGALGASCSAPAPVVEADLVVHGRVYTLRWGEPDALGNPARDAPWDAGAGWHPDAAAVAVRDGTILRVGSRREVAPLIGALTRVLELGDATIVPGLYETHVHAAELGRQERQLGLVGVASEAAAVERVAARAAGVPAGEWIVGHGWDEGAWADRYPTLAPLSTAVPAHPVLLSGLHGFAVWGNRLALERAGIDEHTEDPAGGQIVRDAEGRPTGVLLNRATRLLTDALPAPSLESRKAELVAALEALARAGYVCAHEAGVDAELLPALLELAAEGGLPIRVHALLSARDERLLDAWRERGPRLEAAGDGLVVRGVKAYYDGALGSRGALLLADYSDQPGHRGTAGLAYGFDRERVAAMMRAGFQVAIHAIGDGANRAALDLIEAVVAEAPAARAGRHRIEHAQVVHADDLARFATLDVIASMQPPHAVEDKAWAAERLGPERLAGAYAWRSLRRAGARVIFNSDLPGSDHDIFYGLHAAITRRDRDLAPSGGWTPAERLSPEEALRAYTSWAAHASFEEQTGGVLAAGRRADLTVLDVDPLALGERDPGRLLAGSVLMTIAAGRVVHDGR